jgi:hypothetical protein
MNPERSQTRSQTRMCFPTLMLLLAALSAPLWAAVAATPPLSQQQLDAWIVERLRREGTCVRSEHVVVCASTDALPEEELREFLFLAQDGAQRIRRYLGPQLDLPGSNARPVEFFVSRDVGIPHVTVHQEPWIFIHPRAISRRMAPYLHEMVHAMAQWSWRNSEWVAEGFADHVASTVAEGHPGYHRSFILPTGLDDLHEMHASPAGQEMLPLIGLAGRRHSYLGEARELAERLRTRRREYAPAYYAMSWSFVSYLVSTVGYDGLRRVAESASPSETLHRLTGRSMAEQLASWQATLRMDRD